MKRIYRFHRGQALVFVALTMSMLMALSIGLLDVTSQRWVHARVQQSLDTAALAALTSLDHAALVANTPQLDSDAAVAQFRATLAAQLQRVAGQIQPDPASAAQQVQVMVTRPGEACQGQVVAGPAICATLRVQVQHPLGITRRTFTTLAEATW